MFFQTFEVFLLSIRVSLLGLVLDCILQYSHVVKDNGIFDEVRHLHWACLCKIYVH